MLIASPVSGGGTTLTVNTTATGTTAGCDPAPGDCSFLDAVGDAAGGDTIEFKIPDTDLGCDMNGVCTIFPDVVPTLMANNVTTNGYTQDGTIPNTQPVGNDAILKVVIDMNMQLSGETGLVIEGNGNTVQGLVIIPDGARGIDILGDNNTVQGNFIGTDASGANDGDPATGIGIQINSGSGNIIGGDSPASRNVVSGVANGIQTMAS